MRPTLVTVMQCIMAATVVYAEGNQPPRAQIPVLPASIPVDPAELTAEYWYREAAEGVARRVASGKGGGSARAKNVVLLVGDGMSVATVTAARTLQGQRERRPRQEHGLSFDHFPTVGLAKTYCLDKKLPDSACTATAYLCGVKANFGTLGVTAAVPRLNCTASAQPGVTVESITEWALAEGMDVGVVTTTRVTHSSPAGTYAKSANNLWETDGLVTAAGYDTAICPDIAHQLMHMHPGNKFKVIMGGGRRSFLPSTIIDEEGTHGRREDGRNLIDDWKTDKQAKNVSFKYIWHRDQLMELSSSPPEYLLGLFEGAHMHFHMESDPVADPTLAEMTEVAIRTLSRNKKGFFLYVESGRIDQAHHRHHLEEALDETIELSHAAQRTTEMLSEDDTLVIVTADHAHPTEFYGYKHSGEDFHALKTANDRAGRVRRKVIDDPNFSGHAPDDVPVFAWGPHHDMFSGLYEQTHLAFLMAYAACIGPEQQAPFCNATRR